MAWLGFSDFTFSVTSWIDGANPVSPTSNGLNWTAPVVAFNGPFQNGSTIENDTFVKFKNLDYGDPSLKTLILHTIQLSTTCDANPATGITTQHRAKGEAANHFRRNRVDIL
jgi:hypothetical protein